MSELQFLDSRIKMPLMSLPVRSVVVPLQNARLLISPGSQLTESQLTSAGEITDLAAPSLLHGAGMLKAHKVFPKAKIWGVSGAMKAKPDIPWSHELLEKDWPYQDELALVQIKGLPSLNECVFVHKRSKTALLTDLAFNIRNPKGLGAWLILHAFGTYNRFAVSRFFMGAVKDKEAFTHSLQNLFQYDFDRIVVSHGETLPVDGKSALKAALKERGIHL